MPMEVKVVRGTVRQKERARKTPKPAMHWRREARPKPAGRGQRYRQHATASMEPATRACSGNNPGWLGLSDGGKAYCHSIAWPHRAWKPPSSQANRLQDPRPIRP